MAQDLNMIESWRRGQERYASARYYTPGKQTTQHRVIEGGHPREMELLVVVHDDVPPTDLGMHRVDVIVPSGGPHDPGHRANAHLVNRYDAEAGITDHTALYSDEAMAKIAGADIAGTARRVPSMEEGGGPPGARVYNVRAQMTTNERGELVIDTDAPIRGGSGADRYCLHDVQEGMNRAALRDQEMSAPVHNPYNQPFARMEDMPPLEPEPAAPEPQSAWARLAARARQMTGRTDPVPHPPVSARAAAAEASGIASGVPEQRAATVSTRDVRPAGQPAGLQVSSQAGLAAVRGRLGGPNQSSARFVAPRQEKRSAQVERSSEPVLEGMIVSSDVPTPDAPEKRTQPAPKVIESSDIPGPRPAKEDGPRVGSGADLLGRLNAVVEKDAVTQADRVIESSADVAEPDVEIEDQVESPEDDVQLGG